MDPFTLTSLGLLIGMGSYMMMIPRVVMPPKAAPDSESEMESRYHRDLQEVGLFWGTQRQRITELINLNEVYKPRTAPLQKPTRNLNDIWEDQAETAAYLQKHGPQYHFLRDGSIPLGQPQQSNPNVEIISHQVSFQHDPSYSLTCYPRAYVDNCKGKTTNSIFSNDPLTTEAGEPTTFSVIHLPKTGLLNFNFNPWGPGGAVQNLNAEKHAARTRHVGVMQAEMVRPPQQTSYGASKYPR